MYGAQGVKSKRRFRDGSTRYKNLIMDCNDIIRVRDNLKRMVLTAKNQINSKLKTNVKNISLYQKMRT